MAPPSIAIVGAGPAGLTLAKLLESLSSTNKINLTIYDLDASATARMHQGGTLDLHPKAGLAVLDKMGMMEIAKPFLRYEGEELVIADKNGTELIHQKDAPQIEGFDARPEIDREKLKEILLKAVGEEKVQWGKKLKEVTSERTLKFEDGTTSGPFDLVIGADGAWSMVRSMLTEVKPQYSGICGFEGHIDEPSEATSKMVGRGSYFAYSGGRGITAQRMGNNTIKVGMWVKREKDWVNETVGNTGIVPEKLQTKLCEEYQDWAEKVKDWVRACQRFRKWVLWELPLGTEWEHKEGFTVIGDAAHLCTPFAGLGVNAAMSDALELSELIEKTVAGEISLEQTIATYEKQMFPRAKKVQEDTMRNKVAMYAQDAPIGFMVEMVKVFGKETGWPVDKGFLYWFPITKMAYGAFWIQVTFGSFRRVLKELFVRWKTV